MTEPDATEMTSGAHHAPADYSSRPITSVVKYEVKQEVEEGELSEDESNPTANVGGTSSNQNSERGRHSSGQTPQSHTSHRSDHGSNHASAKSGSSKEKEKSHESSSSRSSNRKRKHDKHESETSKDEEKASDVESFLKKRKQELAAKVKNQLRLAGLEAKIESGSDSDAECIKPDMMERSTASSSSKRRSNSRRGKSEKHGPKYYDLDKIEDPTETMISNWAKGKQTSCESSALSKLAVKTELSESTSAQADSILTSVALGAASAGHGLSPMGAGFEDPLEEYYRPTGDSDAAAGGDRDYRRISPGAVVGSAGAGAASARDLRVNAISDMDYRKQRRINDPLTVVAGIGMEQSAATPGSFSGGEASDHGGAAASPHGGGGTRPARRSAAAAANEFGDIDERGRPTAAAVAMAADDWRHSLDGGGDEFGRRRSPPSLRRHFDDERNGSGSLSDEDFYEDNRRAPFPRERRRSPPPFRRRRGRGGGGGDDWHNDHPTRHVICKYFRDGYCREGDNCHFSHNIEPRGGRAKSELCRFYKLGYCRNGRSCTFMHGDFPCKEHHKSRDCSEGEKCRFSHDPLNDFTRPLFEKMLKEDDFNTKSQAAAVDVLPSKRKVLLGEPPANEVILGSKGPAAPLPPTNGPYNVNRSHEPFYPSPQHASTSQQSSAMDLSYPQSFEDVKPSPYHNFGATSAGAPPYFLVSHPEQQPMLNGGGSVHHTPPRQDKGGGVPAVDITSMLRQIKAEVKGQQDILEESPASPEPSTADAFVSPAPLRQTTVRVVDYKLISFDFPPRDAAYDQRLLRLSISDAKLSNDPRVKRLLATQFDAVSDLISSGNANGGGNTSLAPAAVVTKEALPNNTVPQTRIQSRDPRIKYIDDSAAPQSIASTLSSTLGAGSTYAAEFLAPGHPGTYLATCQQTPPQSSDLSVATAVPTLPFPYYAPRPPVTGANGDGSRWMPQVTPPSPTTASGHWPPVAVPFVAPVDDFHTRDPRSRRPSRTMLRRSPPSSAGVGFYTPSGVLPSLPAVFKRSPPGATVADDPSPAFEPLGNGPSPPASVSVTPESAAAAAASSMSLRERRKDLQYDSPLTVTAAAAGDDHQPQLPPLQPAALRYSGLRIKKKEMVES